MKHSSSYKRTVLKIQKQCDSGKYSQALKLADDLLRDWPDQPQLLVLRGRLIQLQESPSGPTLDDAKSAFERAIDLDPESPAALIELGHYFYAVEDDSKRAAQCFEQAVHLTKQLLKDALMGQAKALSDLNHDQEALDCLIETYWLHPGNGKHSDPDETEVKERIGELLAAK